MHFLHFSPAQDSKLFIFERGWLEDGRPGGVQLKGVINGFCVLGVFCARFPPRSSVEASKLKGGAGKKHSLGGKIPHAQGACACGLRRRNPQKYETRHEKKKGCKSKAAKDKENR